ncbi:nitrogenase component 1 [Natronoflexus pectinivorans]|uniref:Nitrogenase molybdenum-iron protein NifN n=1 Tax=Natronoflexus pectinivorans TaxID=682526 RepID=A0A4R2GGH0_9BACT|nr:nitrogenase component 1 [Natronoflexus pectinivorans]TCO07135.1 nitrogenase molybdenum-iron protein NifN [Natronoflexus pectinivorans]
MITLNSINKATSSTRNACKLCAPLGASLVFKGIEGCVPLIHGSQGCSTYIRRYMISHYKEPVDIASTNFSEEAAVFGGGQNFVTGINNIIEQYRPAVIGIASTCLSETIGEDVDALVRDYSEQMNNGGQPLFFNVATPSYCGTHMNGFHQAAIAAVARFAMQAKKEEHINLFPGFVTPADIRYLKELCIDLGIKATIFPDYSETLDNVHTHEYQLIPTGGTPITDLEKTGSAKATIEFGTVFNRGGKNMHGAIHSAGEWLQQKMSVSNHQLNMPIGIDASDKFMNVLSEFSESPVPEKHVKERGRLIDAYVDAHKYVFGKRAVVYGEEDFVIATSAFLKEIGIVPVLVASGASSGVLKSAMNEITGPNDETIYADGSDFATMREMMQELKPDIMIGNSKGYYIAREMEIPLVRVGFPIHDRFGASRMHHIGYRGTQELFDRIVNALIEYKQENSPVGYKYI